MIRTNDLVEFMKRIVFYPLSESYKNLEVGAMEYRAEIVARLERYDEMKEGIEKMIRDCRDLSDGVDR